MPGYGRRPSIGRVAPATAEEAETGDFIGREAADEQGIGAQLVERLPELGPVALGTATHLTLANVQQVEEHERTARDHPADAGPCRVGQVDEPLDDAPGDERRRREE
jgi:hypothetical protein